MYPYCIQWSYIVNKITKLQPASTFGSQMKPALVLAGSRKVSTAVESSEEGMPYSEQRDRSLTVMIPRAKYRPIPPTSPLLAMSTFGAEQKRAIAQEQQKLLSYLETGNKQVRITEWNYFSIICLTIIAELIEFLFWHALLFILSCCLNLLKPIGYVMHQQD